MKFLLIASLLICSSAFAQKKEVIKKSVVQDSVKQLMDEWDTFKLKMYQPGTNLPSYSDTLDMDISWDEIFKSGRRWSLLLSITRTNTKDAP